MCRLRERNSRVPRCCHGNDKRGGGGYSSDIKVTPMIDILLALVIIFMAIVVR